MPALVRLYIVNCAWGFVAAAALVGMILAADVGHLRHLVVAAPGGWLALALLWVFNGIVFSGVQFGIAVMRLAEREETPPGPGARLSAARPVPVPVPVRAERPRR